MNATSIVGKFFHTQVEIHDEQKPTEFQTFVYHVNIHQPKPFKNQKAFINFLRVEKPGLQVLGYEFTLSDFIPVANTMAKGMKDEYFANDPLLVFKDTENQPPLGHINTDSECKPYITAAFDHHWQNGTTLWPCVRLVGEKAHAGKSEEEQKRPAISYLHYLLLARPDLHVAQGMLISEKGVLFLLGIAGVGIRSISASWESSNLSKLMYAFIYRLYRPGDFADRSYVNVEPDLPNKSAKYTVRISPQTNPVDCPGFFPLFPSNPFGTRTHVLSNPLSQVQVNGQVLTVLKDQLCRLDTCFDEQSILNHIHRPVKIPGVVEAVHCETIEVPLSEGRQRHRFGLRQSGNPFMSIPTVGEMLEMLFDVLDGKSDSIGKLDMLISLQVLRYLRFERKILHRDISEGNILYIPQPSSVPTGDKSTLALGSDGDTLCFIKYLLGKSKNPNETSALLIDFNRAEHLEMDQGSDHERIHRTGTPLFMARAVELGKAPPLPKRATEVPAIPASPDEYSLKHPTRINKFSPSKKLIFDPETVKSRCDRWRHELDHDAGSVFWVLLYWALVVQPKDIPDEYFQSDVWAGITGDAQSRNVLVTSLADALRSRVTHSFFNPLLPLIESLAALLVVDRYWLEQSDRRNQPEYLNEAFQRLILAFILENSGKEFMNRPVDSNIRAVESRYCAVSSGLRYLEVRNDYPYLGLFNGRTCRVVPHLNGIHPVHGGRPSISLFPGSRVHRSVMRSSGPWAECARSLPPAKQVSVVFNA